MYCLPVCKHTCGVRINVCRDQKRVLNVPGTGVMDVFSCHGGAGENLGPLKEQPVLFYLSSPNLRILHMKCFLSCFQCLFPVSFSGRIGEHLIVPSQFGKEQSGQQAPVAGNCMKT